jgi:SAM-dependent methyltransferase
MSYKLYLWGSLNALEWSQAVWKVVGQTVDVDLCEKELVHGALLQHLPKDGLIVDAGCGTGRWPIYLRRLGYRALGVEIDHEAGVIGRKTDTGLEMIQADVWKLPLRAQSVDAILSFGVVEHHEAGPVEALREARRILAPDGLLFLAVPYNNLFRRLLVNHLQTYVNWKRRRIHQQFRFGEYRFTKREIRGFLQQAGFQEVAVYPNDTLPPWTVGLWVDYSNLVSTPLGPAPTAVFILPGIKGVLARRALRWFPWCVCGEVLFVARALASPA